MNDKIPILELKIEEFILNRFNLKDVHAASILMLNKKLIITFFGKVPNEPGKLEEGNSIWVCNGVKENAQYKWSEPQRIVSPQYFQDHHIPLKKDNGVISCANPVITLFNNQLLIFSKVGPYPRTWSGIVSRSYNQGFTWQEPEFLHGILGPTRNKPLILQNTILFPSSRESCIDDFSYIESSSDLRTWNVSPPILPRDPQILQKGYRGFIQPTLVINDDNANNKIIMLVRPRSTIVNSVGFAYKEQGAKPITNRRATSNVVGESKSIDYNVSPHVLYIHRSISFNNGIDWTKLEPTDLLNPDSAIDAISLPNNIILLVYNRVVNYSKTRNILSLAASFNEGVNWYPVKIKNSTFPEGDIEFNNLISEEHSYPTIIMNPNNNEIHIIYTFNRVNFKHKVFKLIKS